MKFSVLAVDYDGTLARDDRLSPGVREALADVRSRGVAVVLATGRRLDDLKRVAGDLHFLDAVVAENGAVIALPATGYSVVLGPPPPASLLDELQRAGIVFQAGAVLVEAEAVDAPRILQILQRCEVPWSLAFNRSRVMVLPQAISKATGLREVLTMLRLSRHNTIAIGDAENDYDLLQSAELGVAVAWGSEFLKATADEVLPGSDPSAVAAYLRALAPARRLPVAAKARRLLRVGFFDEGRPFDLAVRGRNVLIAGDPKSGKSWATGLLCEQLILQGYCVCVLDAEGDYASLHALPGVVVLGGADPRPRPLELLRTLRHPDNSVVIDLSHTPYGEKLDYLNTVLPALGTLRREAGLPHRIVVDEAHYFLHGPGAASLLDLDLNGYTLVTYRASQLHPRILASTEAVIVTRESDPREVAALFTLCARAAPKISARGWEEALGGLRVGEAMVLPITAEAEGTLRRIRLAPRLTPHVRHQTKYIDIPVPSGRAFVFWPSDKETGPRVQTLREFVSALEALPAEALRGHLHRGDFSRWIREVFGDYGLASTVDGLETRFRTGERPLVGPEIIEAVRQRYHFVPPPSVGDLPRAAQPVGLRQSA